MIYMSLSIEDGYSTQIKDLAYFVLNEELEKRQRNVI